MYKHIQQVVFDENDFSHLERLGKRVYLHLKSKKRPILIVKTSTKDSAQAILMDLYNYLNNIEVPQVPNTTK